MGAVAILKHDTRNPVNAFEEFMDMNTSIGPQCSHRSVR